MDRRDFLTAGTSCAAHVWLAGQLMPMAARRAFAGRAAGAVVVREPWGSLERLSSNVWAMISTPLAGGDDARRTLSNGGIVAGRSGVLVIEGFASEAGARWIGAAARELTGRSPTHVVLTHYHGDHAGGLAGYRSAGVDPLYVTTEVTRGTLRESGDPAAQALASAELVRDARTLDLGGVRVTISPRAGHTASDLTVTVEDPRIVFCGDLLWNGLFPNYRDTTPSVFSRNVRAMTSDLAAQYVPGHGSIPTVREIHDYVALLDAVEEEARRAHANGTPAQDAAREFRVPERLGDWTRFSDNYYEVALSAWERELMGQQ